MSLLRRPAALLVLVVLALSSGLGAAVPETGWKAGAGREKITPPAGLWMTGYAARDRPADGTSLDLWAKALAFSDPAGNRGVLITLDLCGIGREITDRVTTEISRRHGLPRSAIMINVSHTHCSPALASYLIGLRIIPADGMQKAEVYTRELEAKMVSTVGQALATLEPVRISSAEDEAHFGFNRRENAEKDVTALRAAGKLKGPFEPRVPILAVRSMQGELKALLVSYACHNTTLSVFEWHGDYAGCAQAELERRHRGATVMFAIGCGADINPGPRRELAYAEQHGRELADAADRALAKPQHLVTGQFRSAFEDITLTFSRRPTEAQLREAREKDQPNKEMHQAWAAAVETQIRTKGDRLLEHAYPIQAWRLGTLSWLALGGEVVIDYSIRLRREVSPDLWVFGYSNDVMAYIPSERVLKEGRYEGDTSMIPYGKPGPWSPGLEEKIVSKSRELLSRVAGKN